jgi:hypothetical protein
MNPVEAMNARLMELTQHDGQIPPCAHNPDAWLSEHPDQRRIAARACRYCPLIQTCAALADQIRPTFGVWAAVDRTPQPRRPTP